MYSDKQREILRLKKQKDILLLAHNYQVPQIQDVADFLGDSLELSRKAAEAGQKTILFCGVDFMAETAKILSPEKKVLIPDTAAQCPMAAMAPAKVVEEAKKQHPQVPVVLYVNTRAEAKALADVCCTSANAAEVVNSLDSDTVLFGPDKNLAHYVEKRSGKKIIRVPDDGYCYAHKMFDLEHVFKARQQHPDAKIIVHPECDPEVQDAADEIGSTGKMVRFAKETDAEEIVVGTETGMVYRLQNVAKDKKFYPLCHEAICLQMKKHTIDKVLSALKNEQHEVTVPRPVIEKAKKAIEKMVEILPK